MNNNKTNGTSLCNLRVMKLSSNSKNDLVTYQYEHNSGNYGPYLAYIPLGQTSSLRLKEGGLYRIGTKKIKGKYHWVSATILKKETVYREMGTTSIENFFTE